MEREERPLSDLLRNLVDQLSSIIRHEIGLARAEMSEKASQAGSGATMLAMALILGIGAVAMGILADTSGLLEAGFWFTGLAMALSALWLTLGMEETHPGLAAGVSGDPPAL